MRPEALETSVGDETALYQRVPCRVDSICVHGDGPTAVTMARAVGSDLEGGGVRIVYVARHSAFVMLVN